MKAFFALLLVTGLTTSALAQDIWGTPEPAKPGPLPQKPAEPAAEAPPAEPAPAAPPRFETVALEAQTYEARVLLGLRQIVLRDFDGALATFRRAAQLEPNAPAAFCHLGDAQLARNDLAEAKAAFETCQRFANVAGDERYGTLALIGFVRVLEQSKAEQKEQREAWVRTRDGTNDPLAKALATSRVAMLEAAQAREASYAAVRRRIVERDVIRESQNEASADPERGL